MKMTPLMIAVKKGHSLDVVHILESEGYDPKEKDVYGFNAEDWAILYERDWHLSVLRKFKRKN